jgi:hypothetical protein
MFHNSTLLPLHTLGHVPQQYTAPAAHLGPCSTTVHCSCCTPWAMFHNSTLLPTAVSYNHLYP